MKKNIIKSLVLSALLGSASFLTSCNDALEIIQDGEVHQQDIFTSVTHLEKFLIGDVYSAAEPSNEIYLTAVFTDELKPGYRSGGQEYGLHRHYLSDNESYTTNVWVQHYKLINRVNRLLEGATKIVPANESEQLKYNTIIAEARSLRAWAYVQLSSYFSTDMKDKNALGVMLVKDVPTLYDQFPRATNGEVYELINQDLAFAETVLKSGDNQYKVDINFVNALQARFNLYIGEYGKAKEYANKVISQSGLGLSSKESYASIWDDTLRGEIVFAFQRIGSGPSGNIGSYFNTNSSQYTGSPKWVWGRNLFNLLNETPGDIRRTVYVDPTSLIDPNYLTSESPFNSDVLIINKYPGKLTYATKNDLKIFRLSEMYFIAAEVEARDGNLSEAADLVNAIRTARISSDATLPAFTSSQDALAAILKERRIELALEGHRLIDLKRLAVEAGVAMDRNVTDDIVEVHNLENGSYKYTLPVPLSELSANPNIIQNPGY